MDESRFSNKVFKFLNFMDVKVLNSIPYQICNMIIIRSLMCVLIGSYLYISVCSTSNYGYLAMLVLPIALIIDTILCCIFRDGNERTM